MFSEADKKQIAEHGLSLETINTQIDYFKSGFPPAKLVAPALENNGIKKLSKDEIDRFLELYEAESSSKEIVKFVPASGAASRMFKKLFSFHSSYKGSDQEYEEMKSDSGKGSVFEFFKSLENFAFYEELKAVYEKTGISLEEGHLKRRYVEILDYLLTENGLNYGKLPKGLLSFHRSNSEVRTPVEEHIVEGAQYAKSQSSVKIHFTVSPEHLELFKSHVNGVKEKYEEKYDVNLDISYSIQNPATDTISVDMDNAPFRNEDGSILFRPAGHGALLDNLDKIDADIIFLKNIDNVVPDHLKEETITYKKVIGGVLISAQNKISEYVKKLESGDASINNEVSNFITSELGYKMPEDSSPDELLSVLNRPIRVCGMVKSDGDPGGGPFWIEASDGSVSLQIVETAQVDLSTESQQKIFKQATHFNPVDVVCAVKNSEGKKFPLMGHRDPETGFVTEKSKDGKSLKAQELPGLWNGSMAKWNTVFVEVPLITFNPVKAVNDLLKAEHQG